MKNPENKPLFIQYDNYKIDNPGGDMSEAGVLYLNGYTAMLSNLAIAESNLVKAGKDSAMPHFIAIVKELERVYAFQFKIITQ